MKNKLLILLFILFGSFVISSSANNYSTTNLFLAPQIDSLDKVVFDMKNAVITANYVDVPVYFLSNDSVSALDFALKYDTLKLTFDSVINYKSYLTEFAHYNQSDHYLRLTSSASDINNFKPFDNNTALFAVRFYFNVPNVCNTINKKDFNSITVYLNGDPCSYDITQITALDITQITALDFNGNNNVNCIGTNAFNTTTNKIINDTISSWFWNFGNGTTSHSPNPVATYTTTATYTVTLIAISSVGCADTVRKAIHVNSAPVASFTYVEDCSTGNFTFIDISSINLPAKITGWNWDFGDNKGLSHAMNPKYDYGYGGSYMVHHTAISDSGCTSTDSSSVFVNMLSAIFVTPAYRCFGSATNFIDSSTTTNSSGPITHWKWYFGDGHTDTLRNSSHVYSTAGTYTVSLTVSNSSCHDSIAKAIMIENKPIVKFATDKISGCMPLTVAFSDSSTVASTSTYVWNFGDIIDSTSSVNISHTYTTNGLYTIKHYVITSSGCIDSLEKTSYINVYGAIAAFTASSDKVKLPDATVKFTNRSNSYTNWTWNFGDSIYSSDKTPEHTYTEAGIYKVCLVGLDSKGCSSNYCDTITVENPNIVAIPEAFTPNGDNINDILRVRGGPAKEMELRIYNEWGNQVFLSNTQSDGWDGTFNGTPQAVGVYEYTVKGKTADNETINMHGVVNLVR